MFETAKKPYYANIFSISLIEEYFHFFIYGLICFLTPFMLGHPQIAVGIVVNASLILASIYVKGHKMLPIIMLPSLGVLARGLVFGPYTIFLVYMIPFIWLGNAILVYANKYMYAKYEKNKQVNDNKIKYNYFISMPVAAILKAGFLFLSALILVRIGFLPEIFLTTMGVLQLTTALAGGILAFGIIKAKEAAVK